MKAWTASLPRTPRFPGPGWKPARAREEAGGLSGAPLTARSTEVIGAFASELKGRIPIIGVGGIMSGADAVAKIKAGASLVQLYTGFIYRGPDLIRECVEAMKAECPVNS